MSIRFRFLLIALFIGLAFVWLKPTYDWYFDTPEDRQVLAGSTKEYIRSYSKKQAASSLTELKNFLSNPEELISEEYKFLVKKAKKNYKLEKIELPDEWTIEAVMDGFSSENELLTTLEQYYRDDIQEMKTEKKKILNLGLDLMGGLSVTIEADKENLAERLEVEVGELTEKDLDKAIESAMTTLSNRVNKFGVSEPQIRRQANHQILVEVPGKVDNTTVASFLHGKGTLNFHLVDNEATAKISDIIRNNPGETFENGRPENDLLLPENVLVLGVYTKDNYDIDELTTYLAVTKEPGLDGTKIKSAKTITNPDTLKPDVLFELTPDGAEDFYDLTSANIGKRLAIVMDGKIKEGAPVIQAGLSSSATMSGFDTKEAKNLEIILQTAALPIDLNVIDEQKVGALLGADTIKAGLYAMLFGFIAVMVFMICYYKGAGVLASFALLLNLVLILGILSTLRMTLTMTSIAGLILNVGMAVDANVIIFERIREELRLGKSRSAAVEAGFKKAFWTVMDANITTLIAAIFLSQLGKGPIKGFALTLAVGICCSLFTAIFVSRTLFNFGTNVLKREKISIGWGIK